MSIRSPNQITGNISAPEAGNSDIHRYCNEIKKIVRVMIYFFVRIIGLIYFCTGTVPDHAFNRYIHPMKDMSFNSENRDPYEKLFALLPGSPNRESYFRAAIEHSRRTYDQAVYSFGGEVCMAYQCSRETT